MEEENSSNLRSKWFFDSGISRNMAQNANHLVYLHYTKYNVQYGEELTLKVEEILN